MKGRKSRGDYDLTLNTVDIRPVDRLRLRLRLDRSFLPLSSSLIWGCGSLCFSCYYEGVEDNMGVEFKIQKALSSHNLLTPFFNLMYYASTSVCVCVCVSALSSWTSYPSRTTLWRWPLKILKPRWLEEERFIYYHLMSQCATAPSLFLISITSFVIYLSG